MAYFDRRSREVLQEIARRKLLEDGLRDFTPTKKQSEFIELVKSRKYMECVYAGANRSGKSSAGAWLGSAFARGIRPFSAGPTHGWVVALDFTLSRDTVQPYYFDNGYGRSGSPFIPAHEIRKWDRQAQILMLKNGSTISFKSCESGAEKFQGAAKDWIHVDEVIPKLIDDELSIRVKAGAPLVRWTTCTLLPPEGRTDNVSWFYNEVVRPWKSGDKRRGLVNASIYDNPHIRREELEQLEARYPVGSMSRRIRMDGELLPGISGSLVYGSFAHAAHVRQDLNIDEHYPVLWAWDFNVSPMASLLAQKRAGRLFVVREFWMDEGSIPEMCALFREAIPASQPVWIYGDATGNARNTHSRRTSYQLIMNELVSHGYVAKLHVPEANPPVADRINAVNTALSNVEGKRLVVIGAACEHLIMDLEGVVYDGNNAIRKVSSPSDPYSKLTHMSDAAGYLIAREFPVRVWKPKDEKGIKIKQIRYG